MEQTLGAFIYLKRKWFEPSSQASLAAICSLIGAQLDVGIVNSFFNVATIAFGTLGFFYNEGKPKAEVE